MLWRHLPIWDVLSGFGCLFQKLVLQMLPFRDTSSRRRRIIKLDWGSFMIKFHRSSPPWNRGWNLLALTSDSKKALTSPRDAWRQLYGASMHSGPASINSKSMAQYVFFSEFCWYIFDTGICPPPNPPPGLVDFAMFKVQILECWTEIIFTILYTGLFGGPVLARKERVCLTWLSQWIMIIGNVWYV